MVFPFQLGFVRILRTLEKMPAILRRRFFSPSSARHGEEDLEPPRRCFSQDPGLRMRVHSANLNARPQIESKPYVPHDIYWNCAIVPDNRPPLPAAPCRACAGEWRGNF